MKNLLSILFVVFCAIPSIGQQKTPIDPHPHIVFSPGDYRVIAPRGINLRSKPKTTSSIVKNIGYGEEVLIIHKDHYGFRYLGDVEDCDVDSSTLKYPVIGYWLKVSHEGDEGFVHSAYIYNYQFAYQREYKTNIFYDLLRSGMDCGFNLRYNANWHYYGIYKQDSILSLKEITRISFTHTMGDFFNFATTTENDCDLEYIIGTSKPMSTGELSTHTSLPRFKRSLDDYGFEKDTIEHGFMEMHHVSENDKRKVLDCYGSDRLHNIYVVMCADFDRDGIDDYLISYGEKSIQINLYLSSEQTEDGLLTPSASYFTGYCC